MLKCNTSVVVNLGIRGIMDLSCQGTEQLTRTIRFWSPGWVHPPTCEYVHCLVWLLVKLIFSFPIGGLLWEETDMLNLYCRAQPNKVILPSCSFALSGHSDAAVSLQVSSLPSSKYLERASGTLTCHILLLQIITGETFLNPASSGSLFQLPCLDLHLRALPPLHPTLSQPKMMIILDQG